MRSFAFFLFALGVSALLALVGPGCIPSDCKDIAPPEVSLIAHIPGDAADLVDANLSFCRNGVCSHGTVNQTSQVVFSDASTAPSASVVDENDGFVEVVFDEFLPPSLKNGDVYGATITSAAGQTLFDVERPVSYDAPVCGDYSPNASLDLYPTSKSGILCGNAVCKAGVTLTGTFPMADVSDPFTVTVCRRPSLCSSQDELPSGPGDEGVKTLPGALSATISIGFGATGNSIVFTVTTTEDTAALHDGDVYTFEVNRYNTVYFQKSVTVTYEASSTNGPQCDAFPCMTATETLTFS